MIAIGGRRKGHPRPRHRASARPAAGEACFAPQPDAAPTVLLQARLDQPGTNVQVIRLVGPGPDVLERVELVRSGRAGLQALEGCELPTLLLERHDRGQGLIDLRAVSFFGLVLYVYPGIDFCLDQRLESIALDRVQHEAYRRVRRQFARVMPRGAIVALSSLTRSEQFHREPELAFEQLHAQDFPHVLACDESCHLADALGLPTFGCDGRRYYERATVVARYGQIAKVLYPVNPENDADRALACLCQR